MTSGKKKAGPSVKVKLAVEGDADAVRQFVDAFNQSELAELGILQLDEVTGQAHGEIEAENSEEVYAKWTAAEQSKKAKTTKKTER